MRYVIQVMTMLSDVLFLLTMVIAACLVSGNIKDLFFVAVVAIVCSLAFRAWKKDSFVAWRLKTIKRFMKNAKKAGL